MFKNNHSNPSTLSELLLKLTGNAKNGSTYLIHGDSQGRVRKLSFRYFFEQIYLTGSLLKDLNAVEGDRIYLAVSEEESIISLFLCGLYYGYSMVVADSEATIHEHKLQIRASKPKFIFADSKLATQLDAAGVNSHVIDCKPRQANKSELFNRLLDRKGQKAEGERSYPGILKACQSRSFPDQICRLVSVQFYSPGSSFLDQPDSFNQLKATLPEHISFWPECDLPDNT